MTRDDDDVTCDMSQVVCSTCVGLGSDQLDGFTFAAVLLDEASQVTEASSIVSICRGCEQLVLVGDQCQLPPTVSSQRAVEAGLAEPLFNRLVSLGVEPLLLDTQYRMHPGKHVFSSTNYYSVCTQPFPSFPRTSSMRGGSRTALKALRAACQRDSRGPARTGPLPLYLCSMAAKLQRGYHATMLQRLRKWSE